MVTIFLNNYWKLSLAIAVIPALILSGCSVRPSSGRIHYVLGLDLDTLSKSRKTVNELLYYLKDKVPTESIIKQGGIAFADTSGGRCLFRPCFFCGIPGSLYLDSISFPPNPAVDITITWIDDSAARLEADDSIRQTDEPDFNPISLTEKMIRDRLFECLPNPKKISMLDSSIFFSNASLVYRMGLPVSISIDPYTYRP